MKRFGLAVITALLLGCSTAAAEKAPTNLKAVGIGPHSIKATWTPAAGVAAQTISASPFSATTNQRHGLTPTAAEYTFKGLASGSYVIGAGSCQLALVEEACHEYYPNGIAEAIATTELPKGWYLNGNSLFEEAAQDYISKGLFTVKFPGTPSHEVHCDLTGDGALSYAANGEKKNFFVTFSETFDTCRSDLAEEGASCGPGQHFLAFITAKENNRNAEDGGAEREQVVEERGGEQFLDFEELGKPSKGRWWVIQPCVGTNGTETALTPNAESGKGNIKLTNRGGLPYVSGGVEVNDTVRNIPIEWTLSVVALETGAEAAKKATYEH